MWCIFLNDHYYKNTGYFILSLNRNIGCFVLEYFMVFNKPLLLLFCSESFLLIYVFYTLLNGTI